MSTMLRAQPMHWVEVANSMMKKLALLAIAFYQRCLSPYKGFRCAYRQHTGRAGCSELGKRVIRRCGVVRGSLVLRQRMYLCGVAYRRLSPVRRPLAAQRGDCDVGCCDFSPDGACHGPCDGDRWGRLPNLFNWCDVGGCDWPWNKDKHKEEEDADVHIPARHGR